MTWTDTKTTGSTFTADEYNVMISNIISHTSSILAHNIGTFNEITCSSVATNVITDISANPASIGFFRVGHGTYTLIGKNNAGASNRELISWGVAGTDVLRLVGDSDILSIPGSFGIGTIAPTAKLYIHNDTSANSITIEGSTATDFTVSSSGLVYIAGDCSALSFTDRTPYFDGDAVTQINNIRSISGNIDHSTLPLFVQKEKSIGKNITIERDLGAMISMLTVAVKQLTIRIEKLEKHK